METWLFFTSDNGKIPCVSCPLILSLIFMDKSFLQICFLSSKKWRHKKTHKENQDRDKKIYRGSSVQISKHHFVLQDYLTILSEEHKSNTV